MRHVGPGTTVAVNGRSVHTELSGSGPGWVVFEAGSGCGRTCWDRVVPLSTDRARLLAYDRAGRALSGPAPDHASVDDMAADLVAMTEALVPDRFVLVAHSMGGLVARLAVETLGARVKGLLLIDPLPETAPTYDSWDRTTRKVDRTLAVVQPLMRFGLVARLSSRNVRPLFDAQTYAAMLAEDFTPAGVAQTRREMAAVAEAIHRFRERPPLPPDCPTIVLSTTRSPKGREGQYAGIREHQRRYALGLARGVHEEVDSGHFVQAERPELVADRIARLLGPTATGEAG